MDVPSHQSRVLDRRTLLGGMFAASALAVAGCSFSKTSNGSQASAASSTGAAAPSGTTGTAAGASGTSVAPSSASASTSSTLQFTLFTDIASLDPQIITGGDDVTPIGLFEALVSVDDTGTGVVPAIAEKWDVSADHLTYTFHIRSSAKFSNGDPITAKDCEWSYQRLLTPTGAGNAGTLNASSYQPSLGIKGAGEFQSGTLKDWSDVGIKATDDKTLVVTLTSPNDGFLLGMAFVSMMVLYPPVIKQYPTDWMKPEHWVGSGPYTLSEWSPSASITMKAHANYWDAANVHIPQATGTVITDSNAALLAYENHQTDITAAPVIKTNSTLESQVQGVDGYAITFLQTMFSKHPASRDARVRQALSLCLDRNALAKVMGPLVKPAFSLVPEVVPGWNHQLAIPQDVAKAKSLLAAAGYPGGKGMPTIQFLVDSGQKSAATDAVMNMWQTILGLDVKYTLVDAGQIVNLRYQPISDPNLWGFSSGGFGGVPTWANWVVNFWGPTIEQFFSLPADKASQYLAVQADKSLKGAAKATKLAAITDAYATPEAKKFAVAATAAASVLADTKRTAAYISAAMERQQLGYQIPLISTGQKYLVSPSVHGFHANYYTWGFYLKGMTLES